MALVENPGFGEVMACAERAAAEVAAELVYAGFPLDVLLAQMLISKESSPPLPRPVLFGQTQMTLGSSWPCF